MTVAIEQVGTIDPYIAAALNPAGTILYVNHDGTSIDAYDYPALTLIGTEVTPAGGTDIGSIACDDAGVLYWWVDTNGAGLHLMKDQSSPSLLFTTVDEEAPVGLCWSPYDGLLYGFGMVDITEGQALSSWDPSTGTRTMIVDPSAPQQIQWINGTVPTPNGHLWYVVPNATAAAWRVRHWSVPDATEFSTVNVVSDAVVPYRDNNVYWYGDPSGATPAGGYLLDADHGRDVAPAFDSFSPGQRAAAYTPNFRTVCFERGATGEVWTFTRNPWGVGRIAWGTRGAWH